MTFDTNLNQACEHCGRAFLPRKRGRPQRFCSDAHRKAYSRLNGQKPHKRRDTASRLSQSPKCANGRQIHDVKCLTALLLARANMRSGSQRPDWYLYDVEFQGELIVTGSADAECATARVLLARGITGRLTFLDSVTGKRRTTIGIERAAKLTVRDGNRQGPMFVKWRPLDVDSFHATSRTSLAERPDAPRPVPAGDARMSIKEAS